MSFLKRFWTQFSHNKDVDEGIENRSKASHEKYPYILEWRTGDKIQLKYETGFLVAIHEDSTISVDVSSYYSSGKIMHAKPIERIHLSKVKYNMSWLERTQGERHAKAKNCLYNEFLQEVQKQYQALMEQQRGEEK